MPAPISPPEAAPKTVDILAIAAHRATHRRTDLWRHPPRHAGHREPAHRYPRSPPGGESGSCGTAAEREAEANEAARILNVTAREALFDGNVEKYTRQNRLKSPPSTTSSVTHRRPA